MTYPTDNLVARPATLLAILLVTLSLASVFLARQKAGPLQKYADSALLKCANAPYRPACYDKAVPEITQSLSLEDSFLVTRLVQQKDPGYFYCHVLGHELSSREVRKNPAYWKDIIPRCPSGMCSNGCIHGAFQERFRAESLAGEELERLKPDIREICEAKPNWHPTELEQNTCYHALGHLLMYITAADTEKSVALCREVALKSDGRNFLQFCYDGAYMQIFQPLEPEDFALVKNIGPKEKDGLASFCAQFSVEAGESCWREGWPLFREEIQTPDGLVEFCSRPADLIYQQKCYNSLFYVLTAVSFNFEEDKVTAFCGALPLHLQGRCYKNAASRFIETDYRLVDKSVKLCAIAASSGYGDECYKELIFYSTFNFHKNSPEFSRLCTSLPEPWKARCLGDAN